VDVAELQEVVDFMYEQKVDTQDEESFITAAPVLKRLANNKTFLSKMVCEELKSYSNLQERNSYSAQVFMLYPPQQRGQNFFMRACFWPADADHVVRVSGTDPFFYHKPHDHNFNFLTVGYHGSGYWSDYYDYEYEDCVGFRGEDARIKFVERSQVSKGKVMLYRAFRDIHNQLPADEFSVTINIMENSIRAGILDQYAFDVESGRLTGLINRMSSTALFPTVAALGDDEGIDLLQTIAEKHPLDRVRLSAYGALASSSSDVDEAIAVWARIKESDSAFLREWRRVRTAELETLR
jgi:hypothetical protein